MDKIGDIIDLLHPLERTVMKVIETGDTLSTLEEKTKLQKVEVTRAIQWLENKKILKTGKISQKLVGLDENGVSASKDLLPELRLLKELRKNPMTIQEINQSTILEKGEDNIAIGMLRKNVLVDMEGGKLSINANGEKALNNYPVQKLIEKIAKKPADVNELDEFESHLIKELEKRKKIIKINEIKDMNIALTDMGRDIKKSKAKLDADFLESLTSGMLKTKKWKDKKFRPYDVSINVPAIQGGKRHFVRQAIEHIRKIMTDFGFKEMKGPLLQTSFWNFDALFTAQDHPVREMQDTFFIKDPKSGTLPDKTIVDRVRKAHENGGDTGSLGWRYSWCEDSAKQNVLRTHTTVLSARTLGKLKKEDLPVKYFAVGRCFRNETMDWSHLFEFNQFEGIVVDENINFRHHIGFLREFFKRLGFPKARFRPAYFPYTEMSLEIDVYHPVKKQWLELGGTGIFRPEVVKPLLGIDVPVLAWGPGFDRIIMEYYKVTDLRDLYRNDLKQLREMKAWMRE